MGVVKKTFTRRRKNVDFNGVNITIETGNDKEED